jgi:hypothetical protein
MRKKGKAPYKRDPLVFSQYIEYFLAFNNEIHLQRSNEFDAALDAYDDLNINGNVNEFRMRHQDIHSMLRTGPDSSIFFPKWHD